MPSDSVDQFFTHLCCVLMCGDEYKLPPDYDPATEPDPAFSANYEFALVIDAGSKGAIFSRTPEKAKAHAASIIARIQKSGLSIFAYESASGKDIIILVGAKDGSNDGNGGSGDGAKDDKATSRKSLTASGKLKPRGVLHQFADSINIPVLLNEHLAEEKMLHGQETIKPRVFPTIDSNEGITHYRSFQYIYGPYSREEFELFDLERPEDCDEHFDADPFSQQLLRIKVVYEILRAPKFRGGCNLNIVNMLANGDLKAFFPLHDKKKCQEIWDNFRFGNGNVKFDLIRDYFGEKIAMYYLFLSHMGLWLIVPGMIGLGMNILVWYYQWFSHPVLPFFAVIISLWSILMLEFFERREHGAALRWGTLGFSSIEQDRSSFKAPVRENFYTGELVPPEGHDIVKTLKFANPIHTRRRMALAGTIVGIMILLVIGVVGGIYAIRFYLENSLGTSASVIASILNAVQIQIFNVVYPFVSKKAVDLENHRTDSQFENSYITKLFFFQFVNSYSSFFFLAFIAQNMDRPTFLSTDPGNIESTYRGQCGWSDCMKPLAINLAVIFAIRLVVTNFLNFFVPWFTHSDAKHTAFKLSGHLTFSPAEEDALLSPYDPILDSIARYSDVAVQYGYMVLFATALPAACAASAVNCFFEARIDLWLMLRAKQRPVPLGADNIGTWMSVLSVLSTVSVITNGALICFTMDVLDVHASMSLARKIWVFVGFQWFFFTLQSALHIIIPDEPQSTTIQRMRQDFIVSKLIKHEPDDQIDDEEDLLADTEDSENSKRKPFKAESYPTVGPASVDSAQEEDESRISLN